MKRRMLMLSALLLFLGGLAVSVWPALGNLLTEYRAKQEIAGYDRAIGEKNASELRSLEAEAGQYNEALQAGGSVTDYNEMLAVTEAIGWLEIPRLELYLPIYHGVEAEVLARGIGHVPDTSLPVGGPSTHCVLAGHTGLPTARMFTDLDQMRKGDFFFLHVLDRTLAYQVDQSLVVQPWETDMIGIVEGEDYVTLLTCIPYGVNSHRLLVRGARAEDAPGESSARYTAPHRESESVPVGMASKIIAIVGAVFGLLIFIRRLRRLKKHRKNERREQK